MIFEKKATDRKTRKHIIQQFYETDDKKRLNNTKKLYYIQQPVTH